MFNANSSPQFALSKPKFGIRSFVVILLATVLSLIVFAPSPTQAYSGGSDCLDTAGGNFNLVIFVKIINSNGTLNRFSNHFAFTINSYARPSANDKETKDYNKYKYNSILYRNNGKAYPRGPGPRTFAVYRTALTGVDSGTDMAPGQGNICDYPGYGKQASYAFRDGDKTKSCFPTSATDVASCGSDSSANRPESDNNGSWLLSCLASNATSYLLSGLTIYDAAGGSWVAGADNTSNKLNINWDSGTQVRLYTDAGYEINSRQARITFTYRLPAPAPAASVTPQYSIAQKGHAPPAASLEDGEEFTAKADLKANNATASTVTTGWRTWLDNGDQIYNILNDSIQNDVATKAYAVPGNTTTAVGTYDGTADSAYRFVCTELYSTSISSGGFTAPPPYRVCVPIVSKPFMAAYGADVVAGTYSEDNQTCTKNLSAGIIGWNHDEAAPYAANDFAGSGGKAGVFAPGNIAHFSSGLNITDLRPTGLSFANDTTAGTNYGGQFTGSPPVGCEFNSGARVTWPGYNAATMGNFSGHKFYVAIGDVYIGSAGVRYSSTSWANLNAIPSFKLLVVKGNIYIDNDVTELDGLYVAIPKGDVSKGHIYTCATAMGTPVPKSSASFGSTCSKRLKIFGAFSAKRIHFDRTYGSLRRATTSDDYTTDKSAEQFIYGPEMWLPNGSDSHPYEPGHYQGLPPVL